MNKIQKIFVFVLFAGCFFSLKHIEGKPQAGENNHTNISLDSMLIEASALINNHPDSAMKLYKEALLLADQEYRTMAKAYRGIGRIYKKKGSYQEALFNQNTALEYFRQINDLEGVANVNNQIGLIYWKEGSFDLAQEYFFKSLDLAEEHNLEKEISNSLNNIGNIYLEQHSFKKAEEFYIKSLTIRKKLGDEKAVANTINNLGVVYWYQGKYEKALANYLKLLEITSRLNDKVKQSNVYTNIAILYSDMEKYDSAIRYYNKAYKIDSILGNRNGMSLIQGNVANTLIVQAKLREALPYALKSLKLAKEIDALDLQAYASELLYLIYQGTGDFEEALRYHVQFKSLNDSVFGKESSEKIAELEIKYETEKKEKENELLRKDNRIQQLVIDEQINLRNFIVFIMLLVVVLLIVIYNRFRIKAKANKELSEKNAFIIQQKEQISQAYDELKSLNKELELKKEQLQDRAIKLKEANATKDKFLSVIAHDLRSPFNAILGFADILQTEYDQISREERQMMLEKLNHSAKNTYNLLDNLLNWARSQTGKLKLEFEKADIQSIVLDCIETHEYLAQNKKIKLTANIQSNTFIYVDKNTITSAIGNLLSNAIKFTKEGGVISIWTEDKNEFVILHIEDNGVGMPEDKIQKIFNINENISSPGTNNERGTGLGLVITQEFIKANKSTITVKSELGKGTDFMITFRKFSDSDK